MLILHFKLCIIQHVTAITIVKPGFKLVDFAADEQKSKIGSGVVRRSCVGEFAAFNLNHHNASESITKLKTCSTQAHSMDVKSVHSWAECKLQLAHVPLPQQRLSVSRKATKVARLRNAARASQFNGEYRRGEIIVSLSILVFS